MKLQAALGVAPLLLTSLPALAQPVAPEAFQTFSEGRTLHFTLHGRPFGAEQFFPGRRTLWRFADGRCANGAWHAEGDLICFVYDGDIATQCWSFRRDGTALRAALVENGAAAGFSLDFGHADTAPLDCPGPDVGS